MRSTLTLQRMNVFGAEAAGGVVPELRPHVTCRRLATIGGARCAGLDHRVGVISPGKDAHSVLCEPIASAWAGGNAVPVPWSTSWIRATSTP